MTRTEIDRELMADAFEVAGDYVGHDAGLKRAKLTERIVEVARLHAERIASKAGITDLETTLAGVMTILDELGLRDQVARRAQERLVESMSEQADLAPTQSKGTP
jgi:hypothetical protein